MEAGAACVFHDVAILPAEGLICQPFALPAAAIHRHLAEKINKKNKNANVKAFMVKNHVWLFINCQIENPAFDSQVRSWT